MPDLTSPEGRRSHFALQSTEEDTDMETRDLPTMRRQSSVNSWDTPQYRQRPSVQPYTPGTDVDSRLRIAGLDATSVLTVGEEADFQPEAAVPSPEHTTGSPKLEDLAHGVAPVTAPSTI